MRTWQHAQLPDCQLQESTNVDDLAVRFRTAVCVHSQHMGEIRDLSSTR